MQDYHSYHPYISRTPFFACQADPRFSYCLYVPPAYFVDESQFTLLTIVHGSRRTAEGYRDAFADFAERESCIVLAPLFPVGIPAPDEQHSYKYLRYGALHYDAVLHAMVGELHGRFPRLRNRMLLHGFSGGGQFAHRYLYLHPERLAAVSVGAPGTVSLVDSNKDWWPGTRDFAECFGKSLDIDALKRVPVHLVVGEEDTETWDVTISPDSPTWASGANDAGATRRERLATLAANLEGCGITVDLEKVPGVAHDGMQVLDPVRAFFSRVLRNRAARR